ncbi:MAG: zinc dependent phospholipase C family protein [Deltaproteobacteria bacterium]|nr:zinc dependent phospholipase C family protein [Deltaproteobacteria bacterium]
MTKTIRILAAAAAVVLLIPAAALAWGPATHLEIGTRVLENLPLLPAALQALLRGHPLDFLYGSIAADIVVAKRLTHYLRHCHRWTVGLEVLSRARRPSQEAFAWGYLAHLAADVVAHNYFVPFKTILSFPTRAMNHAYWEVRFDTHAPREVWQIPYRISREMHQDNDELLKSVLSRTLLSFQTNKVIFNSVVLMGRFRGWHEIIRQSMGQSRVVLDPERVARYKDLSLNAVLAYLIDREEAWCFRADPTGHQSLKAAGLIRAHLRRLYRRGRLSRQAFRDVLERYRPHLEASIYAEPSAADLVETALAYVEAAGDAAEPAGRQTALPAGP